MPRTIRIITVPYHLAEKRAGMGRGPEAYLEAGTAQLLREAGHEVSTEIVEQNKPFANQIDFMLTLQKQLAARVRDTVGRNQFPLMLSGNCNASLGVLGGFAPQELGLICFDAHGDFNTPASSPSGFFDGMALAVIAGLCYPEFSQHLGGCLPMPTSRIVHFGSRDVDPGEMENLRDAEVTMISAHRMQQADVAEAVTYAQEKLGAAMHAVHLHIDIDVLNSKDYPANEFPAAGGLAIEELALAIELIAQKFSIQAVTLSAYNPTCDPEGKTLNAGLRLMRKIAENLN